MDFIAFLVVNAILFIRPSEIVPEMSSVKLYMPAMVACLCFGFSRVVQLFFESSLLRHPTALLSVLLLFFAGFSLIVNRDLDTAFDEEFEFAKVITYFVLFLAIVRTPGRLRGAIVCVVLCMALTALLGVLHFYEFIDIPNLKQMEEAVDSRQDSTETTIRRLRFTGILDGPNEVAVFLSVLTFLCAFLFTDKKRGVTRFFWILPIGLFLVSIFLTRSRGGMLSLLAGFVVFAVYGFRARDTSAAVSGTNSSGRLPIRGLLFLALALPVLLLAFGGRQTEFSTNTHTAQTRFGNWSDWLQDFRYSPIVGVGPKIVSHGDSQHVIENDASVKLQAHNSYLQSFADLGFFGGASFLGAVGFAVVTMHRYGRNATVIFDADLARLQPYLMAALACCAAGFLTLSINYVIPIFFVLALPVAYDGMAACFPPIRRPSLTVDAVARIVAASVAFLAMTYAIVLVMPKQ